MMELAVVWNAIRGRDPGYLGQHPQAKGTRRVAANPLDDGEGVGIGFATASVAFGDDMVHEVQRPAEVWFDPRGDG